MKTKGYFAKVYIKDNTVFLSGEADVSRERFECGIHTCTFFLLADTEKQAQERAVALMATAPQFLFRNKIYYLDEL